MLARTDIKLEIKFDPDHLLTNCMHFPVAREAFDHVEDRDEHPGDTLPTSLLLVPPGHLPEEERTRLRARFAAAGAVLMPFGDVAGALDPTWIYAIVGPVTGDIEVRRTILRTLVEERVVDQVEVLRAAIFGFDEERVWARSGHARARKPDPVPEKKKPRRAKLPTRLRKPGARDRARSGGSARSGRGNRRCSWASRPGRG